MSTRGEAEVSGPTNVGGHAATHSFLNISDARLEEIFERFKEVSGEMKVRHLDDAMRVARMNPQDFEVRRILEDLGNPDSFSLTSFKHTMKDALAEWSSRDQVQELLQCFRVFDRQGTGVLSRQSIRKIMGMGNPSFSEGQLEDMLQKVHGTSPSGAVQYLDLALFLLGPEEEVQEEVQEVEEVPEQKDKGHSEEKKDLPTSSGGWVATWRTSLDAPDPAGPRADEYEVTLDQTNGSRMGIDWLAGGKMLIVQGIDSGGLVEEWNEMMPELEVKENHLIVEANGVRGSAQMIEECMKDQELHLRVLRVDDDDPWSNKDYVLAQVARNVSFLEQASVELRDDPDVILAAVLRDPFDALRFASERLRTEAGYVEELVRRSKAAWLVQLPGLEHFREDLDFVERCEKVAGTGLVFTYYESSTCFLSMRKAFKATGASVPGGIAYDAVMAKLEEEGEGGSATVWFGDEPVFGVNADDGKWRHPPDDCGRDQKEVPAEAERTGMWNCKVEGRKGDVMPIAGRKYNCWCCHWLRKVREAHDKGAVICCAISNIYNADWVQRHGAGSSELSDEQAAKFKQTIPEVFKNGKPDGWGKGRIHVSSGHDYAREAPIHPRTELPLGEGCRWERWALDGQNFAVFAFFMP